jgi:transposase-like protein
MTTSEQRRLTNWRLKLLQAAGEAGSVARTCRHFAVSRKTFYKWRQRYHEHGDIGLADRARAPHRSPRATPTEVVSKILDLRQHDHFGPGKIAEPGPRATGALRGRTRRAPNRLPRKTSRD